MYFRKPILALLLLVTYLYGARVNNTSPAVPAWGSPHIEIEHHIPGPKAEESAARWKVEVGRRFPTAYMVDCHGNDVLGKWTLFFENGRTADAHEYLAALRKRVPKDVPIVCLACNPYGHSLGIPGVYHAWDSVWFIPDKQADNRQRSSKDPGVVGNIFEFDDR